MAKHTPGPWICPTASASKYGFPRWEVLAKDGDCAPSVARVMHFDGILAGQRQSNAHLIAAAPELLEALKEARQSLLDAHANGYTRASHVFPGVNSAIRKAEGADQ